MNEKLQNENFTIKQLNGYQFMIAKKEDIKKIAEVYMRVFRGKPFYENWSMHGKPFSGETMDAEEMIESYYEDGLIMIAKDQEQVIGFAALEIGVHKEDQPYVSFINKNKVLYLSDLGVDPRYWYQGIGSNLFDCVHNMVLNDDALDAMFLRTNASLEVQKEAQARALALDSFGPLVDDSILELVDAEVIKEQGQKNYEELKKSMISSLEISEITSKKSLQKETSSFVSNLTLYEDSSRILSYNNIKNLYGEYVEPVSLTKKEEQENLDRSSMSEGIAKRYGYYLMKDGKGIPSLNRCYRKRSDTKKVEADVRNYYVYEKKR